MNDLTKNDEVLERDKQKNIVFLLIFVGLFRFISYIFEDYIGIKNYLGQRSNYSLFLYIWNFLPWIFAYFAIFKEKDKQFTTITFLKVFGLYTLVWSFLMNFVSVTNSSSGIFPKWLSLAYFFVGTICIFGFGIYFIEKHSKS